MSYEDQLLLMQQYSAPSLQPAYAYPTETEFSHDMTSLPTDGSQFPNMPNVYESLDSSSTFYYDDAFVENPSLAQVMAEPFEPIKDPSQEDYYSYY